VVVVCQLLTISLLLVEVEVVEIAAAQAVLGDIKLHQVLLLRLDRPSPSQWVEGARLAEVLAMAAQDQTLYFLQLLVRAVALVVQIT